VGYEPVLRGPPLAMECEVVNAMAEETMSVQCSESIVAADFK
jgi:hypothetical protein